MSSISRIGPLAIKSAGVGQVRYMATAATQASDPIQKIFLDKVKEFKTSNKGLDQQHNNLLKGEMDRLKRVYRIEDENRLAQLNYKFSNEQDVSLRDLDESKHIREKIAAGQSIVDDKAVEQKSELLATMPNHPPADEFHFEYPSRPSEEMLLVTDDKPAAPTVPKIGGYVEDWKTCLDKMTPYKLQRELRVMFGLNMPTIDDDNKPERDTKNFPRLKQNSDSSPTRHHIVPESWFNFLYPKIGLSGPYTLVGGTVLTAFSKEWIVFEHNVANIFGCILIFSYGINKYGPKLSAKLRKRTKQDDDDWDNWQKGHIEYLEQVRSNYSTELTKGGSAIDSLYDIRKQDIENQLQLEHRSRLKQIYDDTKRKLDYLVSVAETQRLIAKKNMVSWVIQNSIQSIGSKQENEVLDSCISNLKNMSSKHANVV